MNLTDPWMLLEQLEAENKRLEAENARLRRIEEAARAEACEGGAVMSDADVVREHLERNCITEGVNASAECMETLAALRRIEDDVEAWKQTVEATQAEIRSWQDHYNRAVEKQEQFYGETVRLRRIEEAARNVMNTYSDPDTFDDDEMQRVWDALRTALNEESA